MYTNEMASTPTIERKIGIMYGSEYVYAADPKYWNSSRDTGNYSSSDWIFFQIAEWTISRNTGDTSHAYGISGANGMLYIDNNYNPHVNKVRNVRPTFNLLSSVKLLNGTGTSVDPYIVGL